MKSLAVFCVAIISLHCSLTGLQGAVGNGGGVDAWPVANPELMSMNINEIPQWHCLRYFKHDIHLMRRCRNQRFPITRRFSD